MKTENPKSEQRTCHLCVAVYSHDFTYSPQGVDLSSPESICDPCDHAREQESAMKIREDNTRAKWMATVPPEYRDTKTDHPDYQAQIAVHKIAMKWGAGHAVGATEHRTCFGIIGATGSCKTRIISQVVKHLIWNGNGVVWINAARFQWAAQNQFGNESSEASHLLQTCMSASYLVFDDIGKLKTTPIISDAFYDVLEYRSSHKKPILWTSNEELTEILLGDKITEKDRSRIISRIGGYSNIIEM